MLELVSPRSLHSIFLPQLRVLGASWKGMERMKEPEDRDESSKEEDEKRLSLSFPIMPSPRTCLPVCLLLHYACKRCVYFLFALLSAADHRSLQYVKD